MNVTATNQWYDWSNEEKNRAARAARFLWYNSLTYSTKWRREILIFLVLTTTRARRGKSLILLLYMKTTRAKQAKVHSAYFDQHGIITLQSSILMWRFRYSSRRSFLNSLIENEGKKSAKTVLDSQFKMTFAMFLSPSWMLKFPNA